MQRVAGVPVHLHCVLMGQLGELSNVGVDVSVFHLKFLKFVVGFFMFCVVNKDLFEFSFHDLPFVHLPGEVKLILIYFFEPIVLHHDPSFCV